MILSDWEPRFEQFAERSMGKRAPSEPFSDFALNPIPDPAHEMDHIRRVVANARWLAAAEEADLAVVLPAAWLHDCIALPKDSPQRAQASRLAAAAAGAFLRGAGYPNDLIPAIEHAIAAHSFSAAIPPETLEAKVVQDADRLDSLGAIGIARTLQLGGAMGTPLYHSGEPLPHVRAADERSYIIDHFYTKLLKLAAMMHTNAGRREAERRTRLMQVYLDELDREINGNEAPPTSNA